MEPVIIALLIISIVALLGVIVNSVFIFISDARELLEKTGVGGSVGWISYEAPHPPADAVSLVLDTYANLAYQLDGNTVKMWLITTQSVPIDVRIGWPASIRPTANLSIPYGDQNKFTFNIRLVPGQEAKVNITTSGPVGTFYMAYTK